MILEALVNQFVQRFQHEKRAQVCLWFDERQEFERLTGAELGVDRDRIVVWLDGG